MTIGTAHNEKIVQDIYRKSTRYPWRRLVLFTESLSSMDQREKKCPSYSPEKCSTPKKTSMLSYWALHTDNICSSIIITKEVCMAGWWCCIFVVVLLYISSYKNDGKALAVLLHAELLTNDFHRYSTRNWFLNFNSMKHWMGRSIRQRSTYSDRN